MEQQSLIEQRAAVTLQVLTCPRHRPEACLWLYMREEGEGARTTATGWMEHLTPAELATAFDGILMTLVERAERLPAPF